MNKKLLYKIAPELSKWPLNKNRFDVPNGYFDSVEDSILATLLLGNMEFVNNKSDFHAPEDYFNTVEDLVITKLKARALNKDKDSPIPENYFHFVENQVVSKIKKKPKVRSLKSKMVRVLLPVSIAASLLLMIILNYRTEEVTFESLAISEIEYLIDEGIIDVEAENLAGIFPDIELETTAISNSFSDEEVLDYLSNEDLEGILYNN